MATRLYFSATRVPSQSPGFAAWTRTSEGIRRIMEDTKDGSTLASTTFWANTSPNANETCLAVQFISPPMTVGIAFGLTDTIKCVVRTLESGTNDNINRAPICLKVVDDSGATQATLLSLAHVGPSTTEWDNSTLTNRRLADGDLLLAIYTTVAGDRLVLEIGGQVSSAGGNTVTGTMQIGSSSGTDLAENETDQLANNPWMELSNTVTFAPATYTATNSPPLLVIDRPAKRRDSIVAF